MSYEKLGFVSGQKLKAEHLNHMEDGIANAGGRSWNDLADKPIVIISMSAEDGRLSHTPAEILNLIENGAMTICNATGTVFDIINGEEGLVAEVLRFSAIDDAVVLMKLKFDESGMFAGNEIYSLTATKM